MKPFILCALFVVMSALTGIYVVCEESSLPSLNSLAGDLAERMPLNINLTKPEEKPTAGDVVEIDDQGFLKKCATAESRYVVGIVSTNPAHVLRNMIPNSVPIALTGVVPCNVVNTNGQVQPGDLLVSSSKPGFAMKAGKNLIPGTVVGKAIDAQVDPEDSVLVLVMLR